MMGIHRVCLVSLLSMLSIQASWISAARKLFRLRSPSESSDSPRTIDVLVEELKQKISHVSEENIELKKMVRNGKQQIQLFRKELDAMRYAHYVEIEALHNQSIANEDELRNDLIAASEKEMKAVIEDLTKGFEKEKHQLTANITAAHHKEVAKLKETLRHHETTLEGNEARIMELREELADTSKRYSMQHERDASSHQQELSALREELSSLHSTHRDAMNQHSSTIDSAVMDSTLTTETGTRRRPMRKHTVDPSGDSSSGSSGGTSSSSSRGMKSSGRVTARARGSRYTTTGGR